MSPLAASGSRRHRINLDPWGYSVSWAYEVKYAGSRILHHRHVVRDTDYAGAKRFSKKWKVPMPNEVLLWAKRVRKTKRNAYMPDRVIVSLEGRPGADGLVMVCGWSATMPDDAMTDRWPIARLKKHIKTLTKEWAELSGPGWKLEIGS
jgi:hypothetical protein